MADKCVSHSYRAPLAIGTMVKPWGTIVAIAFTSGERYYMFAEKGVAMIPAADVERMAKTKVGNV